MSKNRYYGKVFWVDKTFLEGVSHTFKHLNGLMGGSPSTASGEGVLRLNSRTFLKNYPV